VHALDRIFADHSFATMAGAFCAKRVDSSHRQAFIADLGAHLALAVMPNNVWS